MLFIYGEAQQNSIRTQVLYAESNDRFQIVGISRMFQWLCKKLRESGSLTTRTSERQKTAS